METNQAKVDTKPGKSAQIVTHSVDTQTFASHLSVKLDFGMQFNSPQPSKPETEQNKPTKRTVDSSTAETQTTTVRKSDFACQISNQNDEKQPNKSKALIQEVEKENKGVQVQM